jgi:hypothetical protein
MSLFTFNNLAAQAQTSISKNLKLKTNLNFEIMFLDFVNLSKIRNKLIEPINSHMKLPSRKFPLKRIAKILASKIFQSVLDEDNLLMMYFNYMRRIRQLS